MSVQEMNHEKLRKIINLLDQALYNHQQWYSSLIRSLICKITPDQHDMSPEAHTHCRFGQWYYSEGDKDFKDHPGFKALGDEHARMHQLSRNLLSTIETGISISPLEYDNFSNSLERLRLELSTLKRELENALYNRDSLTGAINRVNLLTSLREQQEISKRENQSCCIIMIDLDHFKAVNDLHGHLIGDAVLAAFSHYFLEHLRPQDKLFRYGGEEFLICMNNIDMGTAFERIENLRKGVAEMNILTQPPIRITASFGMTLLDLYSPVELSIEHADKALLTAKAADRNCTKIWDPNSATK